MIAAERLAVIAHGDQKYDYLPYHYHLKTVVKVLDDYGFNDKKWVDAGWLHDAIEDTEVKTNDIASLYGAEVADMVVSVSGFGNNRKERQADILNKLQYNKDACVLKLADRIANVGYSVFTNNPDKFSMYKKEQAAFAEVVKPNVPEAMWKELEDVFNDETRSSS